MSRRESYNDTFTGEADKEIRNLLEESPEDSDKKSRLRRILLQVIKEELTEKQRTIVIMYYFKDMNTTEIAEKVGITPQAVSALMARARLRIFKILKYYIR